MGVTRAKVAGFVVLLAMVLASPSVAGDASAGASAGAANVPADARAAPADVGGVDDIDAEQARLAEVGRAIAKENCARCHAIAMDDQSPHDKAPPFRDVVERYPSEDLAEALAEGIVSGHPDMPVFVFQMPQIEGFIAYLDSLYLDGLPPPPETSGPDK